MNYTLAVITDDSTINSATANNAGQAWFDVEHPNWVEIIYVNKETEADQAALDDFLQTANIDTFPTILVLEVLENGQQEIKTRLTGENLSIDDIKATALQVLENETGIIAVDGAAGENENNQSGLTEGPFANLLNFNFNLPRLAWAVLAAGATYKSLDSSKTLGQIGFGSVAAYSAYKYSQNGK